MRTFIFTMLYGSLVLVGTFLSIFWTNVARKRAGHVAGRWRLNRDRYFVLATGVATSSLGLLLADAGRLVGYMDYGLSPMLFRAEAWPIGLGLGALLVGFMQIVWLADLETQPPHYGWLKLTAGATLLWSIASVFIAPHIPIYPIT